MSSQRAAMIGRANLAIQTIGLIVVVIVGTAILWAAFTGADRQAERQATEFDFEVRVSQAQTCALVGVITLPINERTAESAQMVVDECYARAGVVAEAPNVPDGG